MGATVRAFAADIADRDSLAKVLATVRAEMPPLTGIIHSAAVIEDAPILNLTGDQVGARFPAEDGRRLEPARSHPKRSDRYVRPLLVV